MQIFGLEFFHIDAGDHSAMSDEQNLVAKQGLECTAARFAGNHLFDAVLDGLQPRQCPDFINISDWIGNDCRGRVQQVRDLGLQCLVCLANLIERPSDCLLRLAYRLPDKIRACHDHDQYQ